MTPRTTSPRNSDASSATEEDAPAGMSEEAIGFVVIVIYTLYLTY